MKRSNEKKSNDSQERAQLSLSKKKISASLSKKISLQYVTKFIGSIGSD